MGAEGRGARWIGAKSPAEAANILASNGNPSASSEADRLPYTLGFDNDALGRVLGAYNEEGHRVSISRDGEGRERSVTETAHTLFDLLNTLRRAMKTKHISTP